MGMRADAVLIWRTERILPSDCLLVMMSMRRRDSSGEEGFLRPLRLPKKAAPGGGKGHEALQ